MRDAIIIGAGPSGLAVGACLKARGLDALILEREATVGSAWRRHYDRLALHTERSNSGLPMRGFPKDWPRYVPRAQVVEYLEDYAAHFDLSPLLGAEVQKVERIADGWRVTHAQGQDEARAVVMATGFADEPKSAKWPGLDSFPGPIVHTRDYRRPDDLPGARVLVIGFGNSGGEIAMELAAQGRAVEMVVRSPVNLLPRELFGIPIARLSLTQKLFGYRVADALAGPLMRWKLGRPERYGLKPAGKGPLAQIVEDNRIPLIDLGTLDLIRAGKIKVRPSIQSSNGDLVTFEDGQTAQFDAILMGTGYRVNLRPILGDLPELDAEGRPRAIEGEIAPGLYGISYHAVPNGQLAAIARQAPKIAAAIARGRAG